VDLAQDISNEFENAVEDELKKVQQQQNEAICPYIPDAVGNDAGQSF
jgi:hypothetical protein